MHPVRCVGSGPGVPEGTYWPSPVGCSPDRLSWVETSGEDGGKRPSPFEAFSLCPRSHWVLGAGEG